MTNRDRSGPPIPLDPRMVEVWRLASQEEQLLNCSNKQEAITLRHQLYRIRKRMMEINHEVAPLALNVKISIIADPTDLDAPFKCRLYPQDAAFEKAFAGIKVPDDDLPPLE